MIAPLVATLAATDLLARPCDDYYVTHGYPGFGCVVARTGDVSGDGVPDLAIGDPGYETDGVPPVIWFVSGSNGSTLQRFTLPVQEVFEMSIAVGADFDGDSTTDLLVGITRVRAPGRLCLISGKTGELLRDLADPRLRVPQTLSTCFVHDVDRDGTDDVAVLCPLTSDAKGSILTYSGRTGARLSTFTVRNPGGSTIGAIARVEDVDEGGLRDLAVLIDLRSEHEADSTADVAGVSAQEAEAVLELRSVVRPEPIWTRRLARGLAWRTSVIAAGGDLAEDGCGDLVVTCSECVEAISGRTGEPLLRFDRGNEEAGFGTALVALDDIDRDAVPDFAFSIWDDGLFQGCVTARSGRDGHEIWRAKGDLGPDDVHHLGEQLASIGDLDGDGIADLAVATDERRANEPGRAEVLSGRTGACLFFFRRQGDEVLVSKRFGESADPR